jgi:hypothetical protein
MKVLLAVASLQLVATNLGTRVGIAFKKAVRHAVLVPLKQI